MHREMKKRMGRHDVYGENKEWEEEEAWDVRRKNFN